MQNKKKFLFLGGNWTSKTNRQVSNRDEGSATYESFSFFFTLLPFYLGRNMWNSFNRWAAEESPGEQKLVSSVSSSSRGWTQPLPQWLLSLALRCRRVWVHAHMHARTGLSWTKVPKTNSRWGGERWFLSGCSNNITLMLQKQWGLKVSLRCGFKDAARFWFFTSSWRSRTNQASVGCSYVYDHYQTASSFYWTSRSDLMCILPADSLQFPIFLYV